MPPHTNPASEIQAEVQRQKTALLCRNAHIAQPVAVVNAVLLAYVNASLQGSATAALVWCSLVVAISAGRYLLVRRFPSSNAGEVAAWRRLYIGATAAAAVAWGAASVLFMWNAGDGARLFTGLVLCGMVAGAVPLLAPVPAAFRTFALAVGVPMAAVVFLQASSALHWAFGCMAIIYLVAMLASAGHLHETLDASLRLGLEKSRLADDLERARSAAEVALVERKSLEAAMRRERDFAEQLIDTAQTIVLVLDTDGRIVRFNRYLEELSGYRSEEVTGANWFSKFLRPGDHAPVQAGFDRALTHFRSQANISPIVAKDGREILVEWYNRTLKDAAGNTVGVLATGQDVTQREKLTESQRLLKAAVEQSNSTIMVTDYDTRIVFVNAGFTQTTGYSADEAIGRNPSMLKSGLTPAETYRSIWTTLAGGQAWHGELCNRKKNGELYWEAANISPIVDTHGRTTHYVGVKDDITLRKQAEQALQEQKNFLATVLETEPECVKVVAPDGRVLQMNNTGLAMLEVDSVEEINAQGLSNFVLPEHRAAFKDLGVRVFGGETGVLEFQVQGKQGTRRWVETHAAPLRDAGNRITHLLGVTRDITRKRSAEERLTLALRGADLALCDWLIPRDALVFGEGWTKLVGYQPEQLNPQMSTLAGLVNPADLPPIRAALVRHLKRETPFLEVEARLRHADGHWIWVLIRAMAVERAGDGRALRVAGTVMDISARKRAEAEIGRLSHWNELLLNSAGEGIYGSDRDGNCSFVNPAALAILGFEKDEVLGRNTHRMFHHHHTDGAPYPEEDCPINLTRRDGIRRQVEDTFIRKSGDAFPVQLSVTPIDEDGRLVGVEVVFRDIGPRKAMEQELTRLANTDPLTGVANRRRFLDQLELELARAKRFGGPAALLMLDIDHFKSVNDTHGHGVGDAVLQHLAQLSRKSLRSIDLFGRLGGEEFGILLPGTDGAAALQLAQRFRREVAGTPLHHDKKVVPFTVSIGVAAFDPGDATPDSVLARADAALYRAKEGGRNRVEAS